MKIAIFSDLHLSTHRFRGHETLFVDTLSKLRKECDELWLLGDIYDLMIGPYDFWKARHKNFFDELAQWTAAGKTVTWMQGNHDFYLEDLLSKASITVSDDHILKKVEGIPCYLAHGDLVDQNDEAYLEWRAKTRSPGFRKVLDLIPGFLKESVITGIGDALSKKSRKKQRDYSATPESEALIKKFRSFAEEKWKNEAQAVFLGHSHVDDLHLSEDKKSFYLNLGTWLDGAPRYAIWDAGEYNYPKVIKLDV